MRASYSRSSSSNMGRSMFPSRVERELSDIIQRVARTLKCTNSVVWRRCTRSWFANVKKMCFSRLRRELQFLLTQCTPRRIARLYNRLFYRSTQAVLIAGNYVTRVGLRDVGCLHLLVSSYDDLILLDNPHRNRFMRSPSSDEDSPKKGYFVINDDDDDDDDDDVDDNDNGDDADDDNNGEEEEEEDNHMVNDDDDEENEEDEVDVGDNEEEEDMEDEGIDCVTFDDDNNEDPVIIEEEDGDTDNEVVEIFARISPRRDTSVGEKNSINFKDIYDEETRPADEFGVNVGASTSVAADAVERIFSQRMQQQQQQYNHRDICDDDEETRPAHSYSVNEGASTSAVADAVDQMFLLQQRQQQQHQAEQQQQEEQQQQKQHHSEQQSFKDVFSLEKTHNHSPSLSSSSSSLITLPSSQIHQIFAILENDVVERSPRALSLTESDRICLECDWADSLDADFFLEQTGRGVDQPRRMSSKDDDVDDDDGNNERQ